MRLLLLTAILLGIATLHLTTPSSNLALLDRESSLLRAAPCPQPEARQFDFWIGEWDVTNRQRLPSRPMDPTWVPTGTFQTKVYPLLDGCVIVEHSFGSMVYGPIYGFSVRAYDPEQAQWVVVNHWSVAGSPPAFTSWAGSFHHGRIEGFYTTPSDDGPAHIARSTFSDVTDTTFRWDSATSTDSTLTWKLDWIMEGHRRDVRQHGPVFALAPRDTLAACKDPAARAFDAVQGTWRGTVQHHHDDRLALDAAVSMRSYVINGGCAVMDVMEIGAEPFPYKRLRVRARDPHSGVWIQYALDNDHPVFERMEGGVQKAMAVLESPVEASDASSTRYREVWDFALEDTLIVRREAIDSPEIAGEVLTLITLVRNR